MLFRRTVVALLIVGGLVMAYTVGLYDNIFDRVQLVQQLEKTEGLLQSEKVVNDSLRNQIQINQQKFETICSRAPNACVNVP